MYVACWRHERTTRRDFALNMLAQHRRNVSQYLVANSKCGDTRGWANIH